MAIALSIISPGRARGLEVVHLVMHNPGFASGWELVIDVSSSTPKVTSMRMSWIT